MKSKNKLIGLVITMFIFIVIFPEQGFSGTDVRMSKPYILAERCASEAMKDVEFWETNNKKTLLCLTNAGYSVLGGGETTESAIDAIAAHTTSSIGGRSLLQVHTSYDRPLYFAFFSPESDELYYFEVNPQIANMVKADPKDVYAEPVNKLFAKSVKAKIAPALLTDEHWKELSQKLGQNCFSLISLSMGWKKESPYDLLQAACFHNHFCPGVTAGYILAGYIKEHFTPGNENESYIFFAAPNWCKDDALQFCFDSTVGKKSLFAYDFIPEQEKLVKDKYENLALLAVLWNKKEAKGRGIALSFDFGGEKKTEVKNNPAVARINDLINMLGQLKNEEKYVKTLKEFEVPSQAALNQMKGLGANPLKVLNIKDID